MDTKFWGSDGWKLLHTIAYIYPEKPLIHIQKAYYNFYTLLKDILPCKYCRASFDIFLKELSIKPYLTSPRNLRLWLYRIHNKVNNKLRKQGLLKKPNPTLQYVDNMYDKIIKNGREYAFKLNIGWDFLFSIIYNYNPDVHSKEVYEQWFNLLAEISPSDAYKYIYANMPPILAALTSSASLQRWFYEFHKQYMTNALHLNCPSFSKTCDRYESIRVPSCNVKKSSSITEQPAIPTCRMSTSI
jgi:hypothetical protein